MNDLLRVLLCVLVSVALSAAEELWTSDLDAALKGRQPVVILVSSESCTWCQVLRADATQDDGLRQALMRTTPVVIDGPSMPAFCARFGIEAFPTLVLVNRRREVVRILRGYLPPGDLAAAIRVLVLRGDEAQKDAQRLDAPPTLAELLKASDPAAAVAAALDAADADGRLVLRAGLAASPPARDLLWALLDHERPGVRTDAAVALAVAIGDPPDYDPLAPAAERRAAIARWRQAAMP
jgi:thioredoxin-related protein